MALITAAEARDLLPNLTGTGEDTLLDTLIAAVGVVFARHCNYPAAATGGAPSMESASYTDYIDGPWHPDDPATLRLRAGPVTAVASIYDDPEWSWGSSTLVAGGDYVLIPDDRRLVSLTPLSTHAWSRYRRAIKVAYTAGYASVPGDLKLAARIGVKHAFEHVRHQLGVQSMSAEGASQTLDVHVMPPIVGKILGAYVIPGGGEL